MRPANKPAVKSPKKPPTTPALPDKLRLEYVPLATVTAWERNPKRHDVGAIWQSIERHGFKDPPKFEPKLNGGRGGIVEGNGRSHVLEEMKRAGNNPPRGIVAAQDDWLMPVLFGVDADSERAAEAYGVDHNNLVLSGGDFGPLDMGRLWDETAYAALLTDLAQGETLPVSVDGEDVDALIASLASGSNEPPSAGGAGGSTTFRQTIEKTSPGAPGDSRYKEQYGVIVMCADEANQKEIYERLRDEGYNCKVVTT